MQTLSSFIKEESVSNINLSKVLKNIGKNKDFIKLLNEYDYEYSITDYPSKDELINGLCDCVQYFIYKEYGNAFKYYSINNGYNAHKIIFDPSDNLYKDGYDYKGKSNFKDLYWYKKIKDQYDNYGNYNLEEVKPQIDV